MGEELMKEVKIRLRSLVVSSPTQMDSRSLMRDYVKLLGTQIPLGKLGYRDFVTFLRERCRDSFLLSGPPSNPILTVIVPDSSKHIDNFVQRSKLPSTAKVKTKRRSIPEARVNPHNLCYNTFVKATPSITEEPRKAEVKAPEYNAKHTSLNKENVDHQRNKPVTSHADHHKNTPVTSHVDHRKNTPVTSHVDHHKNTPVTSNDVKNFLKKRLPLYNSLHNFEEAPSEIDGAMSLYQDDDSGRQTSSSNNSTKALQLEELKSEIMELITAAPEGVWCTDLIRLYRERYNRELNFTRFGYTSIISLAYVLEARVQITRPVDTGDWLLTERSRAAPAPAALRVPVPRRLPVPCAAHAEPDDALPGIDYDPDVFPEDCVNFAEQIPAQSLEDIRPGAMLEVMVGEVYSPSHFWLMRLGDKYSVAMDELMDEMTKYYQYGEGRSRVLATGAVRVGQCCSTLYERDWHRSLIVKRVDSDTVKVRHVDYGTVETVSVRGLRPLRREWAALPAQAIRARLAGVRPSAGGRRWPHAAAQHFLRQVQSAQLVANVVAVDAEHDVLETMLIDTRGADDVSLGAALTRAGHADARPDSALRAPDCYLYPGFDALEGGDTPNMAEIHAYLRDGIALDYVEAYRRHVPAAVPPASPPASPAPSSPAPASPAPASPAPSSPAPSSSAPSSPAPASPAPASPAPSSPAPSSSAPSSPAPASPAPSSPAPASPAPASPAPSSPAPSSSAPSSPAPASPAPASPAPSSPAPSSSAPSSPAPPSPEPELGTCIPLLMPSAPPPPGPAASTSPPAPVQLSHPAPRAPAAAAARPSPPGINPQAPVFTPRHLQAFSPRHGYARPPGMYPLPAGLPPPPGASPLGQWFGPYPAPGGVTLSLAECSTYQMLASVNPAAAHWYMVGAMGRAMATPVLGAPPPRAPGGMGSVRAPPGFGV